ncbi:MAG: PadR family transcriptional regulator [Microcoleus sp. SIO2G3]|nr:PadR family transcriptional regulator [Microcoleus sp. SIO2G3]
MSLTYAILATLADRPFSGYDIAKQFDGSVGLFWQAAPQQIYRELTKLEEQGDISAEIILQDGRPNKKIYSLTKLGLQKMTEWVAQPCKPNPTKDELLVKLSAGYLVDPHVLVTELKCHRQLHQANLLAYQDSEQQNFQNPQQMPIDAKFRYLVLRRWIRYENDWLNWCEEAINLLTSGTL